MSSNNDQITAVLSKLDALERSIEAMTKLIQGLDTTISGKVAAASEVAAASNKATSDKMGAIVASMNELSTKLDYITNISAAKKPAAPKKTGATTSTASDSTADVEIVTGEPADMIKRPPTRLATFKKLCADDAEFKAAMYTDNVKQLIEAVPEHRDAINGATAKSKDAKIVGAMFKILNHKSNAKMPEAVLMNERIANYTANAGKTEGAKVEEES